MKGELKGGGDTGVRKINSKVNMIRVHKCRYGNVK
jgi:hypothetical protein